MGVGVGVGVGVGGCACVYVRARVCAQAEKEVSRKDIFGSARESEISLGPNETLRLVSNR